jgi:hypothetical protein
VLSFFSSRRNWNSPTPCPQASVPSPPLLGGGGGAHSLAREGGGRVPIPTRGHTLWYSLYICTLWAFPSQYKSSLLAPLRFSKSEQDASPRQHSRHQPLWTQSAKVTADSIGHGEIPGVSPLSEVSSLSGVSWLHGSIWD